MQASQVSAPKWNPVDGAEQILQGMNRTPSIEINEVKLNFSSFFSGFSFQATNLSSSMFNKEEEGQKKKIGMIDPEPKKSDW